MSGDAYYRDKLSASRLLKCYEIAPPRIKQYLDAEAQFVVSNIQGAVTVLELGCGYGRVLKAVAPYVSTIVGNDTSRASLHLAKSYMKPYGNYRLVQTDASNMGFCSCVFDAAFCIQNGISAFKADPKLIIKECIRVTKNSGVILFSSYSSSIWKERLDWFRKQSKAGLLGEIDEHKTLDGTIVCRDGFTATTFSGSEFIKLFAEAGQDASIIEVDNSSVFCKVIKKEKHA